MDVFVSLIPLLLMLAIYWWGFRKFKSKHGEETTGPEGQTPYGVHGILAFFIFSAYYMAPLFVLGSVNGNFMKIEAQYPGLLTLPGYGTYKSLTFFVVLAIVVWQIIVARQLRWKLEPASLRNARILCIGSPVAVIAADLILGKMTMNVSPSVEGFTSYLGGIAIGAVWTAYFFLSKRCKNTYQRQ